MTNSITKFLATSALFSLIAFAPVLQASAEDAAPSAAAAAKEESVPAPVVAPAEKKAEEAKPAEAKTVEGKPAEAPTQLDPDAEKKQQAYKDAAAKAFAAIKDIASNLKEDDAKHFYMTYNNYNLVGTVKVVQKDVGNAIKSCGDSNPDMKGDLDARFKTWDAAINDVTKDAAANIENMIIAQDYAEPAKIKNAFKLLDEARAVTNDYIDKRPVTTPEACKHLLGKMDETQENLTSLLRTTLISYARTSPGTTPDANADKKSADEPKK